MSESYRHALRQAVRARLVSVADGSGDIEDAVLFLCEEIAHAFARGHLVALSHLNEQSTSEEADLTPLV